VTIEISRAGRREHDVFEVAADGPLDVAALTVVARALLRVIPAGT
jgi:hypothetical protein